MTELTAKLIARTKPEEAIFGDVPADIQELIAYCARVSNPDNQMNTETSDKLIQFLIRKKHWSPFAMANIVIEVTTTRDIGRQILRHQSMDFQEFSQRYADPTKSLGFVTREARLQDPKNRQNSISISPGDGENIAGLVSDWELTQQHVIEVATDAYEWAIKNGIAKEQARAVLPEGLTVSRMYINGTVRSWIHFLESRLDESTQKEHRDIALLIAKIVAELFPVIKTINKDI